MCFFVVSCLRVSDNTNLGGLQKLLVFEYGLLVLHGFTHSNDSTIELEALGLAEEDGAVLLVGLGCLESGFMHVGVELVALGAGVESLEAVLLECVHEDGLGHLETRVEVQEVLVAAIKLLLGHYRKGTVEVVDAV
jgi:hypothetical protein